MLGFGFTAFKNVSKQNDLLTFSKNLVDEVWPNYGSCLRTQNVLPRKYIAISPPQYVLLRVTFWSSPGSPLLRESSGVLPWLPSRSEPIPSIYLSWSFWLWGRAISGMVPGLMDKMDKDILWRFYVTKNTVLKSIQHISHPWKRYSCERASRTTLESSQNDGTGVLDMGSILRGN